MNEQDSTTKHSPDVNERLSPMNNPEMSRFDRGGLLFLGIVFSFVWMGLTLRFIGLAVFAVAIVLHATFPRHQRLGLVWACWIAFALSPFSPWGLSFINRPGPPRFVPLVMGYPEPDLLAAYGRGEVLIGGCIVNGFEPKWVWVW